MLSTFYYIWCSLMAIMLLSGFTLYSSTHLLSLMELEMFFAPMQSMFYLTLFLVSVNIMLFSYYYFSSGVDYYRFMLLLTSFILSMMLLIFHKGPLVLFVGWDGLGVTSYLLVLYYINGKSVSGATTTVMTNRLGDVFLFIFLVSMGLSNSNSMSYSLLSIFMVLCAFTKSAQAPFSSWLPMAMSAPTPVSSLVHSSTLVTAGLYLLMKYYFFWSSSLLVSFILFFGMLTMVVASVMALAEKDLKKIIALSTLSQLGFMMSGLGLTSVVMSFFHLVTHAFFKSCMFVQVGGMILSNNTSQDGRMYSYSGNYVMMVSLGVSCLSLCGFPLLSGFMSKDLILASVFSPVMSACLFVIYVAGVFMTFLYSLRIMLFATLNSKMSSLKFVNLKLYSSSSLILVALGVSSGWLIFNNFVLPPVHMLYLEKLIPVVYWLMLFVVPYSAFKLSEQLGGMALQDTFVLKPQAKSLLGYKVVDMSHLSILQLMYNTLQFLLLKMGGLGRSVPPLILVFSIVLMLL